MTGYMVLKKLKNFMENTSGETAVQTALVFSGAIIVGVLALTPFLDRAAQDYAYKNQYGIDNIQTSSTRSSQEKPDRYTIRKSVLDGANKN